jgi:hypothetical protein
MKINDVVLSEEQINEFIDLKDFGTFVKSVMSNLGKPGFSWEDIKQEGHRDRAVQIAARAFINKWKNLKANYWREYQEAYNKAMADQAPGAPAAKDPRSFERELKKLLIRMTYQEIGASKTGANVESAIKTIFDAGDYLNSTEVINAAADIITSGIAMNMPLTVAPDSPEDEEKLNKKQAEAPPVMDYGAKLSNNIRSSQDPKDFHPAIIVNWQPEQGPPGRFVKYNNVWYLDLSDRNNMLQIPPSAHIGQKSNDKNLQFAAQNAQRYAEQKWAGGEPPQNWIVNFVGIQPTQTPRLFRLPPAEEQTVWKTRTGRQK